MTADIQQQQQNNQNILQEQPIEKLNNEENKDTKLNEFQHPEDRLVVAVRIRPHLTEDLRRVIYSLDSKTVVLQERDGIRYDETRERRIAEHNNNINNNNNKEEQIKDKQDILRHKRNGERQYEFDLVFSEDATQDDVYEGTTKSLVKKVVQGGSATVLAYGATGSGKTFTMVGNLQQPGVMVKALDDLFREVTITNNNNKEQSNNEPRQVAMSYLEVYNEKIRDLLNPSSTHLDLREDAQGGVRVAGLSEVCAESTEEVLRLLQRGNKARSVEPTAANRTSSRSHAMLQVSVLEGNGFPEGRLLMVDLAGSERAANTKNSGKRLQEGAHINLSLLALGNCITALARGGDVRHINFRDSKLTRLLKGALTSGGGRKLSCVMIAHVSPGSLQREESRTTLLYAERAARISLAAAQHSRPAGFQAAQATIRAEKKRLRNEIERLRARLEDDEEENKRTSTLLNRNDKETIEIIRKEQQSNEVSDIKDQIVASFREQMRARRKLLEIDSQLLGLNMLSERYTLMLRRWEAKNGQLYNSLSPNSRIARGSRGRPWLTDPEDSDVSTSQKLEEEAQHAWKELSRISREQERLQAVRAAAQAELDSNKRRAQILEQDLTSRVGTAWGEREVLTLVCRVHELELERLEAHGEALAREHELRRRQNAIKRHERQRHLCDQIITKQRQIIADKDVDTPKDLEELYCEYVREIYSESYTPLPNDILRENEITHRLSLPPLSPGFPTPTTPAFAHLHTSGSVITPPNRRIHDPELLQISSPNTSSGDSGRESPLPPIQDMSLSISQAMQLLGPPSSSEPIMSPLLPPIRRPSIQHISFGHPVPSPSQSKLPRPLQKKRSRSRGNLRRSTSDEDDLRRE